MTSRHSTNDDASDREKYKRYGFTQKLAAIKGYSWEVLVPVFQNELKVAVLRLSPRERKLAMGEYTTAYDNGDGDNAVGFGALKTEEKSEMVYKSVAPQTAIIRLCS